MREIEPLDPDKPEVIWQIGAFDGYDNVGKMVNNYPNWSFHLFEPMPDAFGVLQRNHKNRHNVHLYNVAVTDTYDTKVDFYIPAILNDPDKTWAPQVCGLTPDIVDFHELEPRKIQVDAVHFKDLRILTKSVPTFFKTDTEGNEHRFVTIVKTYRPKVYMFEVKYMEEKARNEHRCKLELWGYVMAFTNNIDDVWFRSTQLLNNLTVPTL